MNPGTSLRSTAGVLPASRSSRVVVSTVSGEVFGPSTTSTTGIRWPG